jgi:hypothetical protein
MVLAAMRSSVGRARKGALLIMRIESLFESEGSKRALQCSDVYAAPSIGPGFSRLPSWT